MKNFFYSFVLLALPVLTSAQQTINYSILVDSVQREFILYVPASYNGNASAPLILSFHGLGGTAQMQMQQHDFRPVADTAGFIVAHPLGAPINAQGIRGWNFGNASLPDDVLFTSKMIDTIAANFNINLDRVYACGMSFGGFFSIYLAGQLSNSIASIASVAGTILNNVPDSMVTPTRPIALLEIHGTNDNNVAYNGGQLTKSVQYVLDLFVNHNNCDTTPSVTPLANINPNDGSTVERYVYANGDNGTTVEHLKVNGGGHTWPGENTNASNVNRDINGCVEIWKFFSRFDRNGTIGPPLSVASITDFSTITTFPNPAQDYLWLEIDQPVLSTKIYNYSGQEFSLATSQADGKLQLDVSNLPDGIYIVYVAHKGGLRHAKFIKN